MKLLQNGDKERSEHPERLIDRSGQLVTRHTETRYIKPGETDAKRRHAIVKAASGATIVYRRYRDGDQSLGPPWHLMRYTHARI